MKTNIHPNIMMAFLIAAFTLSMPKLSLANDYVKPKASYQLAQSISTPEVIRKIPQEFKSRAPEPSSLAILGGALLPFWFARRCKSRAGCDTGKLVQAEELIELGSEEPKSER